MIKMIAGTALLIGVLTFTAPATGQERDAAQEEAPDSSAPEIRRGFGSEPGFTYQPGFPRERRTQEEFGLSPPYDEEADPSATRDQGDQVPRETRPQEEGEISPRVENALPSTPGLPRDGRIEDRTRTPGERRTQEEFGVSPRFEGEPLPERQRGELGPPGEWEQTDPDDRTYPDDSLTGPETTIQR